MKVTMNSLIWSSHRQAIQHQNKNGENHSDDLQRQVKKHQFLRHCVANSVKH